MLNTSAYNIATYVDWNTENPQKLPIKYMVYDLLFCNKRYPDNDELKIQCTIETDPIIKELMIRYNHRKSQQKQINLGMIDAQVNIVNDLINNMSAMAQFLLKNYQKELLKLQTIIDHYEDMMDFH